MQIIDLTLSNLNLYSPSTGEVICHEDTGYNEEAATLIGYWINEVADQPFIKNPAMKKAWEQFVEKYEKENDIFPTGDALDDFFMEYKHPGWMVFKIQTLGIPGDIAWFVINMEPENIDQ